MKREELIEEAICKCERMIRRGVEIDEVKFNLCSYAIGIERGNIITLDTMFLAMDMYLQVMKRSKKEKL